MTMTWRPVAVPCSATRLVFEPTHTCPHAILVFEKDRPSEKPLCIRVEVAAEAGHW